MGRRNELPVYGVGRYEPALGSLVRNAADETPALAGKLVASFLKSIQAVATMEGREEDMPKPTQHGRFEPQSTLPGILGSAKV